MRISIIIPNYNGQKTLPKLIESIHSSLNINKLSYEILIVDDASTDNSAQLAKNKFPVIKIITLKGHSGASKARNMGIEAASGDMLLFIDSDAWFNKSAVDLLVKGIDNETDIAFPRINYESGKLLYPLLEIEKK